MVVPKNSKQNLCIHSAAIPLLSMHPQELKQDLKGYLHTHAHSQEVEATPRARRQMNG